MPDSKPVNQGDDISGIVHEVGEHVSEFKPGDRVFAFHEMMKPGGSYAEYALSWSATTAHLPAHISFQGACASLSLSHDRNDPTITTQYNRGRCHTSRCSNSSSRPLCPPSTPLTIHASLSSDQQVLQRFPPTYPSDHLRCSLSSRLLRSATRLSSKHPSSDLRSRQRHSTCGEIHRSK